MRQIGLGPTYQKQNEEAKNEEEKVIFRFGFHLFIKK